MSLEDMIATCVSYGVRSINLGEYASEPGYGEFFCLEFHDRDPWRIVFVPKPWTISVEWVGFGGEGVLGRMIPVRFGFHRFWHLALLDERARLGLGTARLDHLEADFLSALGYFLCDAEGQDCPHTVCEFHGECDIDD